MVTFKEYLVEYATKQNSQMFGMTKMKAGPNGKLLDNPYGRKKENAFKQKYKHGYPIIDSICRCAANNVRLAGPELISILSFYKTNFKPGECSVLGNSDVEVEMYEDNRLDSNGKKIPCGVLRRRKKVK